MEGNFMKPPLSTSAYQYHHRRIKEIDPTDDHEYYDWLHRKIPDHIHKREIDNHQSVLDDAEEHGRLADRIERDDLVYPDHPKYMKKIQREVRKKSNELKSDDQRKFANDPEYHYDRHIHLAHLHAHIESKLEKLNPELKLKDKKYSINSFRTQKKPKPGEKHNHEEYDHKSAQIGKLLHLRAAHSILTGDKNAFGHHLRAHNYTSMNSIVDKWMLPDNLRKSSMGSTPKHGMSGRMLSGHQRLLTHKK